MIAYQEKIKRLKTLGEVTNFAKELIAPTLQTMLEAEMDSHLGYPKHKSGPEKRKNARNGHSQKKLKTNFGTTQLVVPRDRKGEFEPIAVKKYESVESDVEEKIISMYAKGMTTRDINGHMADLYGIDVSPTMVSSITDKVLPLVQQWQNRPLTSLYTIVYLDGVHFKVREGGKIVSKCAYIILGITQEGMKEIVGIWVGETEGAKFWMGVLNEIKQRGVNDILICCIDGLKGFPEAIEAVFPGSQIQQCIIHQIRSTTKYIPYKDKKAFCKDLKKIYTATTEEAGLEALMEVERDWPQYKPYLESWNRKWVLLSPFYNYPAEIRRIIYTTNTIESLNRQFRKVTKTTAIFPHDESLKKLLWLAQRDISKKWTMPIRSWSQILIQFSILFPDKIKL